MPALSAVLLTFSFQFGQLFFMSVARQCRTCFSQCGTWDISAN